MATTKVITGTLNSMVQSIKGILPLNVTIGSPSLVVEPYMQNEISVLIGITGDFSGRMLIDSNTLILGKLSESMYGMALEGDMLQSFAGELGNMIAGNLSTNLALNKIKMDITPPSILVGTTRLYGFNKALQVPVLIDQVGELTVMLMYD